MLLGLLEFVVLSFLFSLAHCQSNLSAQAIRPAFVPLAVGSPYFSAWLSFGPTSQTTNTWPTFWDADGNHILGWAGHIRIDNTTYRWFGNYPGPNATTMTNFQLTPTRTIMNIQAGPMNLTATFLTPIEPSDWVQQSIPFSYLALEATSNDGKAHDVQVYSDISAEWMSGNRSALVNWTTIATDSSALYHKIQLQSPEPFTEILDQAEDGTAYFAMASTPDMTWQTGGSSVRPQFAAVGSLLNTQDTGFRGISNDFPVFAISVDLGTITSTQSPVVWSVGYVRDPVIQYTSSTGETQPLSPYYVTQYQNIQDAINAFASGFSDAQTRAEALDKQILTDAASISPDYGDLVSLAARQVFGGIDITVPMGSNGYGNTSDARIFMKDIGTSRRVSPVEGLYAAFPMFLYLNASFGKPLLSPLLEYQDSSQYTLPYAARDLGPNSQAAGYPIASGDSSAHSQGVEQTSNMLIMALAHARYTGDGSLVNEHYNLLKNWTDYLVSNALLPNNQLSADSQSTANMTNLAIKGIIGIQAMSEISRALGRESDVQQYASVASSYFETWQSISQTSSPSPPHILASYGQEGSWALMYNLYADRILGTGLVSQNVYDMQTDFYQSQFSSASKFGLPIDSDAANSGNSAWLAFTAATASNSSVRDQLLAYVYARVSANQTVGIFPTTYAIDTGNPTDGSANPAQGAVFAPLALTLTNHTISVPPVAPTGRAGTGSSSMDVGAIVGGVVGGVIGAAALCLAAFFLYRRRRRTRAPPLVVHDDAFSTPKPDPFPYAAAPFDPPTQTADVPYSPVATSPPAGPIVMSSKLRQYMAAPTPPGPASTVSSTAYASTTPASSREPPSEVLENPVSPRDIVGLREEMQNLRRVMQEIQVERLEAPPSYGDE
ncbi:hypothetical protein AcV7_004605 [Taiwanofungus camphoratus]|nr:hypothetical protein AcV7_004605 [Antrodia cinnamomea]